MKHKSLDDAECPIARSLDHVGEWWSILILREAYYGAKKFDEFQKGVEGITPSTLTRRLKHLVDTGLFKRHRYSEKPERYEYVLTKCGRDFYPIMWTLMEWGNKYFAPEGIFIQLKNIKTRKAAIPFFADRNTGKEMLPKDYQIAPGPAASAALYTKIATSKQE
ncbi:MAG: helix-turn-helix transcriptional regulator [Alphaproteobacteria bacterium]|nr:helix-turn-helix transcriptional regulator [Alphaproteobacteria bacterium]